LLERRDVVRAVRLYGGRAVQAPEPPYCFKFDPPDPVGALTATIDQHARLAKLTWTNPDSEGLAQVTVNRRVNDCPIAPDDPAATAVLVREPLPGGGYDYVPPSSRRGATVTLDNSLQREPAGTYCYAVWTLDEAGRHRVAATATVQYEAPPRDPDPCDPDVDPNCG
jgi:hypothetical protein